MRNKFDPCRSLRRTSLDLTGMRIKNTTYLVGIHFNNASEQEIEEKMKDLIIKDVGRGKRI